MRAVAIFVWLVLIPGIIYIDAHIAYYALYMAVGVLCLFFEILSSGSSSSSGFSSTERNRMDKGFLEEHGAKLMVVLLLVVVATSLIWSHPGYVSEALGGVIKYVVRLHRGIPDFVGSTYSLIFFVGVPIALIIIALIISARSGPIEGRPSLKKFKDD
jgi:hypothetical protein